MLTDILTHKRHEVAFRQTQVPLTLVQASAARARPSRDFREALRRSGISLIAEVKRRSPSCGELRQDFDPVALARAYAANGARAISVLADRAFFGGGPEVVQAVANDSGVPVPVMWKDFVLGMYQVFEARAAGADAVLLIARAVEPEVLPDLLALCRELGMAALVEVFNAQEAELAVTSGADIVGINNRDLATFAVNTRRSAELRDLLPADIVTVSESGLNDRADLLQAERDGFDAVLVGEALVRAPDVPARVRQLLGLVA